MAGDVQFGILGPTEVVVGGHRVSAGQPKQRAVLSALLMRANQVVSLDQLINDLWGEQPPAAATGSLQAYVANLRRVLEPGRGPRAPSTVLLTRAPGYMVRVGPDDLDVARFEAGLAEGTRLLDDGQPRAAHRVLEEALALWRGPALADLADYAFAAPEITRLEQLRLTAAETRAAAGLALGWHSETIPVLERLVAEAPLRERPRELLMLALYRSGRQADALGLMAATRRLFAEELGIDPSARLHGLQDAILRQDAQLDWRPPTEEPDIAAHVPVASPGTPHRSVTSGLVGRAEPLARLRLLVDEVAAGCGRVVLLAGEPGIGKTRLAEEIAADAARGGIDVAWGRCPELEGAPPLWPWAAVIAALAAARPAPELAAATEAAGPHLAPLAPDLAPPAAPLPTSSEQSRFLLCDAATRLLLDLAARRPVMVVLDDLHWADPPTLELAGFLAGHLHAAPILLLGTFRDSEVEAPLADLLAAIAREPGTERIRLAGLRPAETAELVARVAVAGDRPMSETLAAEVHERTEGNPFFVTELTRLIRSEGRLGAERGRVPANVRDVLSRRLRRLPGQSVAVLQIGALAGREFDLDLVTAASGLDEDEVLTALEAAVLTGLLVEDPGVPGRHRFVHDLVRETLHDGVSPVRRSRLHARILEVLLASRGERDVEALAHHGWWAGPACPPLTVLQYVLAAAEAAERALAFERALQHLDRARLLIGRLPPDEAGEARELEVQHRLAVLMVQTRGYAAPGVEDAFARSRDLATRCGRVDRLAEALYGLFAARCVAADFPTTIAVGERLMRLGRESGDREILQGANQALGIVLWHLGRLTEADAHLSAAVALADEPSPGRLSFFLEHPAVSSRGFRSAVRRLLGDAEGASRLRSEALELAGRPGQHPYTRAFALFHAAHLAVYEHDPDSASRWARQAIKLCREHGFGLFGAMCEVFDGWAAALHGERGVARIEAAQKEIEAGGTRMLRHFFLGLRAEAELAEGRAAQARGSLEEAFAASRTSGESFWLHRLHELRAVLGDDRATRRPTSATPLR